MIDAKKVIDTMHPLEFRFRKWGTFSEFILPLMKYNEQYLLLKQFDEKYSSLHYYIITLSNCLYEVVGRFDVSRDCSDRCGITYHILNPFQNRGIGQMALHFVVDDLFSENIDRIILWPTNERSCYIAQKNGFKKREGNRGIYELSVMDYQALQSNSKKII